LTSEAKAIMTCCKLMRVTIRYKSLDRFVNLESAVE
jgi:hypothetical protein